MFKQTLVASILLISVSKASFANNNYYVGGSLGIGGGLGVKPYYNDLSYFGDLFAGTGFDFGAT